MINKMYFYGCMGILAASAMLSSCSSDNDDPTPSPNPGPEVVYKWTTNGGLKACDHILFGTDDKENANGTQIGNGDQEFVFTGISVAVILDRTASARASAKELRA